MGQRLPLKVAGLIFSLVAILHVVRLTQHWAIMVGPYVIPTSVSIWGFIIAAILAVWMFKAASR